ncbi:MAG TPA: DUF3109 family protein [Urbifossiella sp.]|nr:DUF3109 family protein [Urbifossiella sp.]
MPALALPVVNADATFDCSFGRGCDGVCCRNGRPSVDAAEAARITALLPRVLPRLRPEARKLVEAEGVLSNRKKLGNPMVRVTGGWCVLFNAGCTLHGLGAEDGDPLAYKPSQCALFPLEKGDAGWFVRQWGYEGEQWDLFCLNPANTARPALDALAGELALAARFEADGPAAG